MCLQTLITSTTKPEPLQPKSLIVQEVKSNTPEPTPEPTPAPRPGPITSTIPTDLPPTNSTDESDDDDDLPPKLHPVKQAVYIYQNIKQKMLSPTVPTVEYFDHAHQVQLLEQVDIEYRKLFDHKE